MTHKPRYRYRVTAHIGEKMVSVVVIADPNNFEWHTAHVEVNNFDETGWHMVDPDYVDSFSSIVHVPEPWIDHRRSK